MVNYSMSILDNFRELSSLHEENSVKTLKNDFDLFSSKNKIGTEILKHRKLDMCLVVLPSIPYYGTESILFAKCYTFF